MKNKLIVNSQNILRKMIADVEKEARRNPQLQEQINQVRDSLREPLNAFEAYRAQNRLPIDTLNEVLENNQDELNGMFDSIQMGEDAIRISKSFERLDNQLTNHNPNYNNGIYINGWENYAKQLFKAQQLGFSKYRSFYYRNNILNAYLVPEKGFTYESIIQNLRIFNDNVENFIIALNNNTEHMNWLRNNCDHFLNLRLYRRQDENHTYTPEGVIVEKRNNRKKFEYLLTHPNFGNIVVKKKGQCSLIIERDIEEAPFIERRLTRDIVTDINDELEGKSQR